MKILVVEDDERIAQPLKEDLEHQQYKVSLAQDGLDGLKLARQQPFDVILLDLMLPSMDGETICRTLREDGCMAAIIMITARNLTNNKIHGLDSGADDYLVKPFEVDELAARIRAVMRRNAPTRLVTLRCEDLVLDPAACTVTFKDTPVDLTRTEYRLLFHFMQNPQRVFSKEELLERLWESDNAASQSVIKAHIKGLRNKLAAAGAPRDMVITVHGFGYRLKNGPGDTEESPSTPTSDNVPPVYQ